MIAGGLFVMDRKYFNELGKYDTQMDVSEYTLFELEHTVDFEMV